MAVNQFTLNHSKTQFMIVGIVTEESCNQIDIQPHIHIA